MLLVSEFWTANARPLMRGAGLLSLIALAASTTACDMLPFGAAGPEVVDAANGALKSGDLPGAGAQYAELTASHAGSVHVAIGQAYMQMLQGDNDAADATLASVEESAGEALPEVKLRRAIVAMKAKDLDAVKLHGSASGLPEGMLLAGEVHLVDLEADEAAQIFRDVSSAGGTVGQTATTYLEMLDSEDQIQAGLAEATALWALGERESACESAEELVPALSDDDGSKAEQLLVWAGRAVTTGKPSVASSLLDNLDFPPEGHAWRVQATRAIISVAEGDADEGIRILDALAAGGAPADGIADARATACALAADRAKAKELVAGLESSAAARCLMQAGADRVAPTQAPDGALKSYLENK
jgi:hypothetical protein